MSGEVAVPRDLLERALDGDEDARAVVAALAAGTVDAEVVARASEAGPLGHARVVDTHGGAVLDERTAP